MALLIGAALATYFFLRPDNTKVSDLDGLLTADGYVELRPPSNFFMPGTWVEILSTNPLHLSIICSPSQALGLNDTHALATSGSETVDIASKLAPRYALDAELWRSLKTRTDLSVVRDISFSLSNVRLLEITDDAVFGGFKSRTAECKEAIAFRLDRKNPVSMIKAAFIADVAYVITFDGDIGADVRASVARDLALDLGVKVDNAETSKSRLVGQGLIWGIRDDSTLAQFGYALPSTGGPQEHKSILLGHGPVVATPTRSASRATFSGKLPLATADVRPLKQPSSMGCWATVYAMLRSWKDGRDWTVPAAAASLGPDYAATFAQNTGLPGRSERTFVRRASMVAEPPASYTLRAWVQMLKDDGPLWVTLGDGISSHALLLVGIYGTSTAETDRAYDDAVFEFIDPEEGTYYYEHAVGFMRRFEEEARIVVESANPNTDLRWQIIHWQSRDVATVE